MEVALFFIISLLASVVGSISGVGGGILIKPSLETFASHNLDTVNFLSGCAVLTMAMVALVRRRGAAAGFEYRRGAYLAGGSIIGGVAGKAFFDSLLAGFGNDPVSLVQAVTLGLIMVLLLIYFTLKDRIAPRPVRNDAALFLLGGGMGLISAFLGIGGGPLHLAVLSYFLAMDNIRASLHSLYIIVFAQVARLAFTLVTDAVPDYPPILFVGVITGAVLGALIGCRLAARMNNRQVGRLYALILAGVFFLSLRNALAYLAALA